MRHQNNGGSDLVGNVLNANGVESNKDICEDSWSDEEGEETDYNYSLRRRSIGRLPIGRGMRARRCYKTPIQQKVSIQNPTFQHSKVIPICQKPSKMQAAANTNLITSNHHHHTNSQLSTTTTTTTSSSSTTDSESSESSEPESAEEDVSYDYQLSHPIQQTLERLCHKDSPS
ncbi:hypothetical protein EVAR_71904_1 [Eumeta japonica]|uniref:Uncharacterized protein n=1 Tax=Eumeta variegata TaxID=151549 RepID=A0A4C1TJU2_EUMVA|nr:hypothetical protein EVAR_71904_1 [Eumeta japonica]